MTTTARVNAIGIDKIFNARIVGHSASEHLAASAAFA